MESEALEQIIELTREADGKTVEIDGVTYSTTPLCHNLPQHELARPLPGPFMLHTLQGFCDYVMKFAAADDAKDVAVHVAGPGRVALCGPLEGHHRKRVTYAIADTDELFKAGFAFGKFMDTESFIVGLQVRFVEASGRADVLKLVGNLRDEHVKTVVDDGVTQVVTARAGVAKVEDVDVPNPVRLMPFRTFREIDQPASVFVLRMRRGDEGTLPTVALFEADGGAWKLEAIQSIAAYIEERLAHMTPPLAIIV